MEVKNLFDQQTYNETVGRLLSLTPESSRKWGKMDVAQMLAHCSQAFKVPLSEKPLPRMLIGRLFGWAFRRKLYDNTPWKTGLPTAPNFKIRDSRDFQKERTTTLDLLRRFYENGPEKAARFAHPVFGKFTGEQWGKSMWKHLDHHLRQFGN